jgi:RNA polymerase sigma-70 factor, ECF subfamily
MRSTALFAQITPVLFDIARTVSDSRQSTVLDFVFPLPLHEKTLAVDFTSDFGVRFVLPASAEATADAPVSAPEEEVVTLFDESRSGLLRYLFSFGLHAHDAEEVVQEAFLLLFLHLQRGNSRENLRGWIFRVARNLALKLQKENHTRLRRIATIEQETRGREFSNDANPEDEVWIRQRQLRLLAVVKALPGQDRDCLLLRAEGLRYREIASALGISLGSVAASMARTIARLERADGGTNG